MSRDRLPPLSSRQGRWRRRLRRAGLVLLALWLVVTAGSLLCNAVTAGRAAPPPGLTYVRTGDVQTRYRVWGDPAAPGRPIVLVHGAFESADTWAPLASLLARAHRVEAYDTKGSATPSARRHLPSPRSPISWARS